MSKNQKTPNNSRNNTVVAAILAWAIPGMGHIYLGKKNRGIIIMATIVLTFIIGLVLGGYEVIDPQHSRPWFLAQVFNGIPAVITAMVQNPGEEMGFGRGIDMGQVYTGIAGLLNLLCILDTIMPNAIFSGSKKVSPETPSSTHHD